MAITDVLRGLLGGTGGALAGYGMQRQREQERSERNRQIALQEALAEDARARQRAFEEATMIDKGYRLAEEDEPTGPMTFQPRGVKLFDFDELERAELAPRAGNIPAPEVEDGRITGTGAAAAPGQTYSAVRKALEDTTKEYEGPEAYLPSIEQRGFERRELGGRTYLRPDEELMSQVERDRELREKIDADERDLQNAIRLAEAQFEATYNKRYEKGQEAGLTGQALMNYALGREKDVERLDPFEEVYRDLVFTRMRDSGGMLSPADFANLGLQAGVIVGLTPDEVQARVGAMPSPPPPPGGGGEDGDLPEGGGEDLIGGVLRFTRGDSPGREALRERTLSEQVEFPEQIAEIDRVLESGVYEGKPLSGFERMLLERKRGMLSSRVSREPYGYERSYRGPG